ncbi:MAG TPA: cell division protein ZipA, partial [Halieaceae bacterium]|nr:cell division protein ZipA [Halieaceae bacterium]
QDPSPVAPTRTVDWLEALELSSDDAEDEMPVALIDHAPPDHVLLIHVKAEGHRPYRGDQLLQLLLACDLRFGDLGFFHRHEHAGGRGPIQFSVSNLLKPGVFDIDAMSDLEAAGIVLFMRVPGPKDLLTAYDAMLETAKTLVHHLGGSLLDHSHSVLTKQAIEHDRSLLRDYARRQLLHRKP